VLQWACCVPTCVKGFRTTIPSNPTPCMDSRHWWVYVNPSNPTPCMDSWHWWVFIGLVAFTCAMLALWLLWKHFISWGRNFVPIYQLSAALGGCVNAESILCVVICRVSQPTWRRRVSRQYVNVCSGKSTVSRWARQTGGFCTTSTSPGLPHAWQVGRG